jgi:ketosteroid isomerase-like protein/predicted enzyme related to lactoylglutathione lyase
MVNDLDEAVTFYTKHLRFQLRQEAKPNFAMLSLGSMELVLSTPFGPGGAAKPMSDGRRPEAGGGWNRLIINVDNLAAEIVRLREANVHFRNDIATGPGGSEILLDDPSGNPVELFQPATVTASGDAEIKALMDKFAAAFNAGDIDAIMKNYIADKSFVIFDVVPRKRYLGADAYREYWEEMFSHFEGTPKITITDLGITAGSNIAFSHSFMRVTGTDRQGQPVDRNVRVTDAYCKIGNSWLIALEHISVPVDFATGKADLNFKQNYVR